jgi:16S rRNA processing protein RimM
LRGDVVVHLWTDQTQRLEPGSVLFSSRGRLTVASSKPLGQRDRYLVCFEGVADRPGAESLHGVDLEAESLDVSDALWIHELVGATVRDTRGTDLGTVGAVEPNPASDLLVLESGGLIPMNFVVQFDAGAHVVEVDIPEGLLDL